MAKKIKITIVADEYWVADSLHDLGSFIENSDMEYEQMTDGFEGDHYKADLEIVEDNG